MPSSDRRSDSWDLNPRTTLPRLLAEHRMSYVAFSPLAQGLLTNRYLDGVPTGSRAAADKSLFPSHLSDENLDRIRGLAAIAEQRGQSLAQMAVAWTLRDPRVSSALIGASNFFELAVAAAISLFGLTKIHRLQNILFIHSQGQCLTHFYIIQRRFLCVKSPIPHIHAGLYIDHKILPFR